MGLLLGIQHEKRLRSSTVWNGEESCCLGSGVLQERGFGGMAGKMGCIQTCVLQLPWHWECD